MLNIKIKKLNKNVQLPKQGTQGAAGMDFYIPMPNSIGVIDSDYRGEVCALLRNTSNFTFTTDIGERLVQGVIVPVPEVQIQEVEELSETSRGVGGFGSTGK